MDDDDDDKGKGLDDDERMIGRMMRSSSSR